MRRKSYLKKAKSDFSEEYKLSEAWQNFLDQMSAKELEESTQDHYTMRLKNYFADKQLNPDSVIEALRKTDNVISTMKHMVADLREYYGNVTGRTFRTHLSAWKEFVRANEINVDWSAIPTPKGKPVRERFAPSKEEIVKLLDVSGIREKTAILIMCSSGVRISGLVNLKVSDIDLETGLMKVSPKTSKSEVKYRTVMSREALDCLKEYLELRGLHKSEWLFEGSNGGHIDRSQVWRVLNDNMKIAGLIKKEGSNHNGAYRLTPHSFRRFFKGQSVEAKANRDFVETLMGHLGKNVGTIYLTSPDSQVIEMYREQIEPYVTFRDYKELKLKFEGIDLEPSAWNRIAKIIQQQTEEAIKKFYEEEEARKTEEMNRRLRQAKKP